MTEEEEYVDSERLESVCTITVFGHAYLIYRESTRETYVFIVIRIIYEIVKLLT